MKRNKPLIGTLIGLRAARAVLPPPMTFREEQQSKWSRFAKKHQVLLLYFKVLLFFGVYAGLFFLPHEYPINVGAYTAVVLVMWPIVFHLAHIFINDFRWTIPQERDWYLIKIVREKDESIRLLLQHNEQIDSLFWPFHYEYFYRVVDRDGVPAFQSFIFCTDQKNQQFILFATWKWLPERYIDAQEIVDIPEEWYQKLLLICNAKYLLTYLRVLTKLEANPQNGAKETNL